MRTNSRTEICLPVAMTKSSARLLLEHHPLHADVVLGVAPVAEGIHVAEEQAGLEALGDVGDAAGDLAGDEGLAAARRLVVEEDAVAGIHAVGLAVVHGDPVGIHLGHRIGRARVERRGFRLRDLLDQAVELGGGCLIEAGLLFQPRKRIASSRRSVPMASTSAVYSGASKETATWDCAPRL